jgi:hypothetical protein
MKNVFFLFLLFVSFNCGTTDLGNEHFQCLSSSECTNGYFCGVEGICVPPACKNCRPDKVILTFSTFGITGTVKGNDVLVTASSISARTNEDKAIFGLPAQVEQCISPK